MNGILCDVCGSADIKVVDTRPIVAGRRRRYECIECGARFTTIEYKEKDLKQAAAVISAVKKSEQ